MTILLLALLCLAAGFAGGWWYVAPRRQVTEALARRSRVLYELAEGDVDNVAHELERVAEVEPGDSTVFLALAALDRRRGRIERAKALLRDTDQPIIDIAFQTGWSSLGTFGRVFRDVTGESPTELRAREQAGAHALDQVPHCFISAAYRPNLKSAVSEKRRQEAADKTETKADEASEDTK